MSEKNYVLPSDKKRAGIADRHPLKRIGTIDDVASISEFLFIARAGWITGQAIALDGGMSRLRG